MQYVLDRSEAGARFVTVLQILITYVDTTPDAVKFAAAMAACDALGITLDPAPSLEQAGMFVFPP